MTPDETAEQAEPDYRFTLANERTFLAWQRTALGLLAAAVAIVQFVPELGLPGARHVIGAGLTILAMLCAGLGLRRWRQVDHAMRRATPLPPQHAPVVLGLGLVVLGVLVLAIVVARAVIH
ncbi:MAG: putative rane protein [Mycobacterium sp.]|nr:putative rane protein [Mycobacterium sp.]